MAASSLLRELRLTQNHVEAARALDDVAQLIDLELERCCSEGRLELVGFDEAQIATGTVAELSSDRVPIPPLLQRRQGFQGAQARCFGRTSCASGILQLGVPH